MDISYEARRVKWTTVSARPSLAASSIFKLMRFHRPWFWLVAPVLGVLAGLLYSIIFDTETLTGSAIRGAFIGSPILLYERASVSPLARSN